MKQIDFGSGTESGRNKINITNNNYVININQDNRVVINGESKKDLFLLEKKSRMDVNFSENIATYKSLEAAHIEANKRIESDKGNSVEAEECPRRYYVAKAREQGLKGENIDVSFQYRQHFDTKEKALKFYEECVADFGHSTCYRFIEKRVTVRNSNTNFIEIKNNQPRNYYQDRKWEKP